MRLMLGLDHGGGVTTFDGRRLTDVESVTRTVGAHLDAKYFHPKRTARAHLRMLATEARVPDSRVDEVLEVFGLTSVSGKRPKGFSLGMGQRLGLAGAVLAEPRALMLDEPANGLDPQSIHWMRDFLKAYAERGNAVLVSSHLLSEMQLMADHVVVIAKGELVADGSMADLVASSARNDVLVRTRPEDRQVLLEGLSAAGAVARAEGVDAVSVVGAEPGEVGLTRVRGGGSGARADGPAGLVGAGVPGTHRGPGAVPDRCDRWCGMSRILAFEWRRAVSLRSTWGFLGIGMALMVFIAWAAMIFNGGTQEGAAPGSQPSMEGVATFDGGGPLGIILITTICAQAFGHEYRDGTMRLVLSQFPKRAEVFLAKVAVPAAFVTASILLALLVAVAGAALIFDVQAQDGWGGVAPIGLRQVALGVWWGLMVAGVTALIRNLAAGIIASLVFALILENLAIGLLTRGDPVTGDGVSRAPWLTENLPFTNALQWASQGDGRAATVAALWALGVVGLACLLFIRRDA